MIYLWKLSQFFSLFVWIQSHHGHNPLPSMTPHFNSWVWNLQMWPTLLWISCNFFLSDYDKRMFLSPAYFQPIHHRSNRIQKITTEAFKVLHNGGSGTELVYLASRGAVRYFYSNKYTHIYRSWYHTRCLLPLSPVVLSMMTSSEDRRDRHNCSAAWDSDRCAGKTLTGCVSGCRLLSLSMALGLSFWLFK